MSGGIKLPSTINPEKSEFQCKLPTLLDQAAVAVAKHKSTVDLEQHYPPLDETLLKKIAYWSCPQDPSVVKAFVDLTLRGDTEWYSGEKAANNDGVHDMMQIGFMVTAVTDNSRVFFTFEKQHVTSTACAQCPKRLWCVHLIAAVLYRIKHGSKVPIYAPMTEALSSLNRDQLQKLIQFAVKDTPGMLDNVFRRMGQIRDFKSEIRKTAGAPDPTFGLVDGTPGHWVQALDELRGSFDSVCTTKMNEFPYSFCEQINQGNWIYTTYIQRVVDFIHNDQTEAAGRVLITLTTVAADRSKITFLRSKLLLKLLERMCSLYILQFTGEARRDLILVCQHLNKKLKFGWTENKWADLPTMPSFYPQGSGVVGGLETSMFYEPLCVSFIPSLTQSYYDSMNGVTDISNSAYSESLPLMMLRFEALRLWKRPDDWKQRLQRLGIVILQKLVQLSFQFSILNDKERVTRIKDTCTTQQTILKRKAVDDIDDICTQVPPVKKTRQKTEYSQPRKPCSASRLSAHGKTINLSSDAVHVVTSDGTHDFRNEKAKTANDESDQLMAFSDIMDDIESDPQNKMKLPTSSECLSSQFRMLESLVVKSDLPEPLPKESLPYCLMHICCSIYELHSSLSVQDSKVLSVATLLALEFSRFRTAAENRGSITMKEHEALINLERRLTKFYEKYIGSLAREKFSSGIHGLYMKLLCDCNLHGVCFYDCGVPLLLISFLVETSFSHMYMATEINKKQARHLCLHTLCHSYKPIRYYIYEIRGTSASERKDVCKESLRLFGNIMSMFLKHVSHPERVSSLVKLLEHYENVQDVVAVRMLWKRIGLTHDTESKDVLTALAKFMMHCIKFRNTYDADTIGVSENNTLRNMSYLCSKLGKMFIELVVANWQDVVTCFSSFPLDDLLNKMKGYYNQDVAPSVEVVNEILNPLSGEFQHDVKSCEILTFFKLGDNHFDQAVTLIRDNIDNFTPEAVLFVARMCREHQTAVSGNIPSGEVFSLDVELFVKGALKRLMTGKKPCHSIPSPSDISCLPSSCPHEQIQWIFEAFTEKPSRNVVRCKQFKDILTLVREVFADDLPTILSVCACVENETLLLTKCTSVFGKRIIQLVHDCVFEKWRSVGNRRYDELLADLGIIQNHLVKYVCNGREVFIKLVGEIKLLHNTKRKLLAELNRKFKF